MTVLITADTPGEMAFVEAALRDAGYADVDEALAADPTDETDTPAPAYDKARDEALSLAVMSFRQPDSAAAMTPPDTATIIQRATEFHRWLTRS